jgi:RNA polymerase sigma-B factor
MNPQPFKDAHDKQMLDRLFVRWREHKDPVAREELTRIFLPLAHKLARRYARSGEPMEDLDQVASLALLKAIDRFDPTYGSVFPMFATPTILGELRRYFRDTGWSVHVPRSAQELVMKIQNANEELTTRTGRAPSVQDLSENLDISIEDVLEGLYAANAYETTSLETPTEGSDEKGQTLGETIGAEDERYELVETGASAAKLLRDLPERERRILHMRFIQDMTQTEIAAQIGISQMQVSRLLRGSLTRLTKQAAAAGDSGASPP